MKTVLVSIALSLTSLFLSAQSDTEISTEGTTITITIPVHSSEGNILVGLYEESNFMQNPTLSAVGEIKDGKSVVILNNVVPGEYGITLVHDKNNNKRMDFDSSGMPLEMFGVSNNNMSYGPPLWSDAKFDVAATPIEMEIRL
tara:strand:+ start:1029 stop:1457 length:429 start_codon:yes stop_codon:yes gene_type:complete